MKRFLAIALLLVLACGHGAFAQSTAAQVQPGTVGTSGCPSINLTPCFLPYSSTNPLPVNIQSDIGTVTVTGNVGGYTFFVPTTPTIQNASYVSGNCMGGFQAISVGSTSGLSGTLAKITLMSKGGLVTAKQIYVFTSNPSGSTCTDKSTFTIAAADLSKLIGTLSITPAVPTGGAASVGEANNLVFPFVASGNTNVYIAIVETTTETPGSTTDLVINIAGIKDAP